MLTGKLILRTIVTETIVCVGLVVRLVILLRLKQSSGTFKPFWPLVATTILLICTKMLSDVLDFLHFVVLFGGKETRFITQKDKVQSIGASSNTHRPPQKKKCAQLQPADALQGHCCRDVLVILNPIKLFTQQWVNHHHPPPILTQLLVWKILMRESCRE